MTNNKSITEYTESEFLEFLQDFFVNRTDLKGARFIEYQDKLMQRFETIIENPQGSDLICYPGEGAEDSPQGVLDRVKQWRAANGKPGFKPA
ncbi:MULTISPECIES: bacteriocin immunity protein [unclassified Pseudomonas]|uniref:bacteriocin immunity protein n=1 Tax=unclassified Pseudomonas TaxID=196821 RepID=UPI000C884B4E|nr:MULTISPECIES: bacteriocin immunity protein [unclassified Pseudomonas]PMZ91317.1 bacteriocin immunity protein [Pseudomonas sp. FW305-42]PNA26800.1 bacteriocin immunity protein [Pseudomonas sp. MPR-R1B]PNB27598.1 bacteriocin immunity protein [Pseudomonas sp. DP16D-E2]PNB40889.1 bacteriocin immunity protein [Pseudomonas sp. FW305-17]PNB56475.1 bacteriocin immunity protein [Pseudomonas sp. GW531-E2]